MGYFWKNINSMKTFNLSILISLFILSSKILFAQFPPKDCPCIDISGTGDYFEIDSVEYFHTVYNDTIRGKVPASNNYTGYVNEFRKNYKTYTSIIGIPEGFETNINVVHQSVFSIFKIFEGNYIGGEKTGLFTFYHKTDCYDYTIEYMEDSIIRKPVNCYGFKLVCTSDSSFCYGNLKTLHNNDIHYKCENSTCKFYHKGAKTIVLKCDQIDLESSLYGFYYGNYDREIRKALLMEQ
jgi:hypothetical protein